MKHALWIVVIAALLGGCRDRDLPNAFQVDEDLRDEFFTQLEPSEADILWVIDSSCSMTDEQLALVENFPRFIEFFVNRGLSFRIAVTTTNVDEDDSEGANAGFVGDTPWLTEDVDDIEEEFLRRGLVGVDQWHSDEKGLTAAHRALASPPPGNEDFIRFNAHLAVIVVSDEPDFSARPESEGVEGIVGWEAFATWLNSVKGPTGQRRSDLSAIVGIGPDGFDDPLGCGGDFENGEGALRGDGYLEAAQGTGGSWMSICETDWGDMMGRVGLRAAGLLDAFTLDEIPEVDSLRVWIDGDEVDGWVYREFDNAIAFVATDDVPLPGEITQVRYRVPDAE